MVTFFKANYNINKSCYLQPFLTGNPRHMYIVGCGVTIKKINKKGGGTLCVTKMNTDLWEISEKVALGKKE